MAEQYNKVYDVGWTYVGVDSSTGYPLITNVTPPHVLDLQEANAKRQRRTQPGLCKMDSSNSSKPPAPILSGHVKPINTKSNNKQPKKGRGGRKAMTNQYTVLDVYDY